MIQTELLKIAADVVNRKYLPSLENCRTISDARLEIARYDSLHIDLAMRIKKVWEQLRDFGSEVKPRTGDKQDFCPEIRMNSVCCGRYNENGVCQKCGITRDEPRTGEGS